MIISWYFCRRKYCSSNQYIVLFPLNGYPSIHFDLSVGLQRTSDDRWPSVIMNFIKINKLGQSTAVTTASSLFFFLFRRQYQHFQEWCRSSRQHATRSTAKWIQKYIEAICVYIVRQLLNIRFQLLLVGWNYILYYTFLLFSSLTFFNLSAMVTRARATCPSMFLSFDCWFSSSLAVCKNPFWFVLVDVFNVFFELWCNATKKREEKGTWKT